MPTNSTDFVTALPVPGSIDALRSPLENQRVDEPTWQIEDSRRLSATKRVLDFLIALFALLLFFPLFVLVALLVWREDKGPVIYRQERIGRNGVPFYIYKFRSMRVDADHHRERLLVQSDAKGAAFKMKQDPRVTRIGRVLRKSSIDELPQLVCVLAGRMSIVGPRPHLASEVATYSSEQRLRLVVKPGLLCLREVMGRSRLSFDEWLALDLEYVRSRSLWLDARIFLLAFSAVLRGDGAY